MVDVDVLKAQLVRQNQSEPWGFWLSGGADVGEPLTIVQLNPGSPAARIGLLVGDEIVKIGDRSTVSLTNQQSQDLIESQSTTLLLTVERQAGGNASAVYQTAFAYQQRLQNSQPSQQVRNYQPVDMTGTNRSVPQTQRQTFEYRTVQQQRPFDAAPTTVQQYQTSVSYQQSVPGQSYYQPDQSDFYLYSQYDDGPSSPPSSSNTSRWRRYDDDVIEPCAQSRTFKMLQTVMHNEEPAAGVSGLPPPRSAAMEQLKRQRGVVNSTSDDPHRRVKVFMPQQYNSPMAMYSAHNVLETFTTQAENMLDSMERRRQRAVGDEYDPVYSTTSQ